VLGIIGGSILAIIFGFVARSRIKRSGASGGGMATAGIILGFVWLALCGGIIALGVSGVFDSKNADDFAGPEKPVAQTVDDVEQAFRDHDGDRACNELFTPAFRERLTSPGKTCAQVVEEGDEGKIQAEIDVASISIVGNRAIVSVDEGDTPEFWTMLRTDRWRVDDISER
jgi:hypothetical protein